MGPAQEAVGSLLEASEGLAQEVSLPHPALGRLPGGIPGRCLALIKVPGKETLSSWGGALAL